LVLLLDAPLVALSTCSSAMGAVGEGDEIIMLQTLERWNPHRHLPIS
jgi:hypothetical protein